MISRAATVSLRVLPLACLQIKEYQPRYVDRLMHYVGLLVKAKDEFAGVLTVVPSDTHPGMFCILDGHTRYCASVLTGKQDALCLVVEEPA